MPMKALRELYFANLTEFLSNRRALFLTIAFPVLFIVVFGLVFTNQDKIDVNIGLANADDGDGGPPDRRGARIRAESQRHWRARRDPQRRG